MHSNVDVGMYCKRDTVSRFLDVSHSVIPPRLKRPCLAINKTQTNKTKSKSPVKSQLSLSVVVDDL